MQKSSTFAKKVISVAVTIGMIISMFACMSGLAVFAVDNTPAASEPVAVVPETEAATPAASEPVAVAPVTATATTAEAKNEETEHIHCRCGAVHQNIGDHTADESTTRKWTAYAGTDKMPPSGTYYLTEDITVTSSRSPSGGTFVCLNGHTVTFKSNRLYSFYSASPYGPTNEGTKMIVITDCKGTGKITTDGSSAGTNSILGLPNRSGDPYTISFFGGIFDFRGQKSGIGALYYCQDAVSGYTLPAHKLNIYGGTFYCDNSNVSCNAGLISLKGAQRLTVHGGTFNGGILTGEGGIIYASGTSTVNITGGTFNGGTLTGGGGVIKADGSSTVNISGGTINGATLSGSSRAGGAINSSFSATVNISGTAVIQNGYSTGNGGNICSAGNLTITGGTIQNGEAGNIGGNIAVFNSGKTLAISGGTVKDGSTPEFGGNIAVFTSAALNISGTAQITGGTAAKNGGSIYATGATINVSGGTISGGNSEQNGGNIAANNTPITITGGIIENGVSGAAINGGGCIFSNNSIVISGGTIQNGTATFNGGNILSLGTVEITGGTIQNGEAGNVGGNIFISGSEKTLTISGGTVKDGSAEYGGNILATASSTVNISGTAQLIDGTAAKSGGNIYSTTSTINISGGSVSGGSIRTNKSTVNVSGGPQIADDITLGDSSFVEATAFNGNINLIQVLDDCQISNAWDADYIAAEKIGISNDYTYDYNNGAVTLLANAHIAVAAAVDALDATGEVHLADRDTILAYNGYNDTAKGIFENQYNYTNLADMTVQAEDYDAMMETKVAVRENFGADGDRVLYVIYSSMDEADLARYDYAQIILTINGVTKGDDATLDQITDVYRTVNYNGAKAASADDYTYDTANGHSDKSDYVYYTTLSLSATNAAKTDVQFDFFARIYLVGGGYVDGTHVTGTLADLLSGQD